ncbi:riboflavin synthase [bacterium]|nr:riboflavin synthase [bacterium]
MFTGLIEETGKLKALKNDSVILSAYKILQNLKIGDSVAVNGCCLTVTQINNQDISFQTSPETKKRTRFNLAEMRVGELVNLERPLRADARLDGHLVQGHIDGKAKIINIKKSGSFYEFEFLYPKELKPMLAKKGSVAIDGISLTIANVMSASFTVAVIPKTMEITNLKNKLINDYVHIEVDVLARYVFNMMKGEL